MNLDSLIDGIAIRHSGPDVEVVDLTSDSREVSPGWAFLALKGEKADGAVFVPQAVEKGACAVISESQVDVPDGIAACRFLAEPRLRMAEMARRLHGTP